MPEEVLEEPVPKEVDAEAGHRPYQTCA